MKSYHAEIIGMTCDNCVRAVKNRLSKTDGVTLKDVQVGSADFSIDESKISMADIEEAISDEGYTIDSVESR
jgi:copper chaperone